MLRAPTRTVVRALHDALAMAFEASHVDQYVLINENERFKFFRRGRKDKLREKGKVVEKKIDKKLGDNFWSVKGPNGETTAMGFDTPAARCTDGAPSGSKTHLNTTSYTFAEPAIGKNGKPTGKWKTSTDNQGGGYINANEIPYIVLPRDATSVTDKGGAVQLNQYGQHKATGVKQFQADGSSSPFKAVGMLPGDYVKVTNPANGKSAYAIVGELGPHAELGEYSVKLMNMLGMKPTSTISQGALQVTAFPGSGKRTPSGSQIQKQNSQQIQQNGKAAEDARSAYKGGYIIFKGIDSVLIGKEKKEAAFADPTCLHSGGGYMLEGSDSVSYGGRPAVRVGDPCSIGQASVSGEPTVQVFGNPTTLSLAPPPPQHFNPFPLGAWADRVMGSVVDPLAPPTSLGSMGGSLFDAGRSVW